ncbi:CCR4-NOT transcription complex subunit 6-like [Tyrophagus putrescentiae]|nr:CCR4-NOT transcription complex subunit 6-like [Tyrophagus putrescentiae]
MSRPSHRDREKYEPPNPRRSHVILQADDANGKETAWFELEITGSVRNLSPQLWSLTHLTSLYLNDNCLTRVPPDICKLTSLQYLDLSTNKLRNLPAEIGDLIMLRELLLNNNILRSLPYELGKLFQLQNLGLKNNPLTQELLVIYNEPNGTQKLLAYLLDNLQPLTTSTPPQRPWIPLAKPTESNISNVFTVMCYNVLCDKYATRQLYGYCPNWALSWDYRRNAIMQEIKNFDADIISLQEVETEQFYNYFQPQLANVGYEGIFSPKSRAKTMTESERRHVDGCAIFFKTDKFSLVKEHLIEFNQLAMANAEGSDDMLNRVMTKDNISLVALLQTKDSGNADNLAEPSMAAGQPLVVCTAHIHWDPEYCDVKLIQTMMLMHELKSFVDEAATLFRLNAGGNKADSNSIPLIMCCDLNSLPDSGVVEYLSNGRIAVEHPDFKEIAYKDCLRKLSPIVSDSSKSNSNEYTHAFELIKAYKDDVMPFTNYTYDFKGVIDYIFCSKTNMSVLGVLGPLDTNWLRENKIAGCPHQYIPSDHFPLIVEIEMIPKILSPGMVSQISSNSGSNSGAANGHLIRRPI